MIIQQTALTPISGQFTNASEGSQISSNGQTYRISYVGGDGNDLVLTALTNIEKWRHLHFQTTLNAEDAADLADPDQDGVVNLLEYATGSSPTLRNATPGTMLKQGSVLTFSYVKNPSATDVVYSVEWSDSLQSAWSTSGLVITQQGNVVTATIPASVPRRFVRLKVTIAP
jgi:hypothetical protein